ncbi:MAG: hypothetical protein B6244_06770 [Candidatus Cloacimonetes bacterium 4572_55]|nr:MAG: hypothetical protein B6244_06770 [Candidatus Cloacimonetes bacterium 4572_55]
MASTTKFGILVLIFSFLIPGLGVADDLEKNLDITGQMRIRHELNDKDFNEDTDSFRNSFLRTRINFRTKFEDKLNVFVQVQDARVFGTESSTLADGSADALDIHQAYFQINRLFWSWLSMKTGRMEMVYGGQRLIGAVGWHNIGRSFDGSKLTFTFDPVEVDIFSALLYESGQAPDSADGDQFFGGIYAKTHFLEGHTLDFYLLANVDTQENADEDPLSTLGTFGAYYKGKFSAVDLEAEIAFQGGEDNTGAEKVDIAASMITGSVGYTLDHKLKPRIAIGIDMLSGNDPDKGDEYGCFNTLFATNHKFYGFMDYFLNVPLHTSGAGLTDMMVKASLHPCKKIMVKADFHMFATSEKVDINGSEEDALGTEVDLTLVFKYLKNVKFNLGLSFFSPDEVMKSFRGEDSATWGYCQTVVNF